MTPIERQILESLQFLISMKYPKSDIYQEEHAKIMAKNHLLLNPISKEESACEMPEDKCKHDWETFCNMGCEIEINCNHKGRLCRKCKIDYLDYKKDKFIKSKDEVKKDE